MFDFGESLHRIENPNIAWVGATLTYDALPLAAGSYCNSGIGNATVRPPSDTSYNPPHNISICSPDTATTLTPGLSQSASYNYVWDNGDTAYARPVTHPGRYRVVYWASCHKIVDSFIVENVDTRFNLGSDTTFCNKVDYPLHIDVHGATYLWQDGSTDADFTATQAGQYYAMTSLNGCRRSDTITVALIDVRQYLGPDTILCREAPVHITLQANDPPDAAVLWSTGSILPAITATDTGYYWVTVTIPPCTNSDTIHIGNAVCDCLFLMPTAFTPNNDGLNDIAMPNVIPGCSISNYILSVYNRYGQRVFSSAIPDRGWDGRHNGAPADVGTYFYELRFSGGKENRNYYQRGDITLIR